MQPTFNDDFTTVERELEQGVILLLWFLSVRTYLEVITGIDNTAVRAIWLWL
jgi:hypothetical protein